MLRFSEPLSHPEIGISPSNLLASYAKVFEIPFNSKNKWILTIVRERNFTQRGHDTTQSECWMLVKGAPDILFSFCTKIMKEDGPVVPLYEATLARILRLQSEWSNSGLRVLALVGAHCQVKR
jgi:sodium/potassium-transporting ATPase subunit alpha